MTASYDQAAGDRLLIGLEGDLTAEQAAESRAQLRSWLEDPEGESVAFLTGVTGFVVVKAAQPRADESGAAT